MNGSSNTIEIDIEWGDCDPARIVFYPNYFAWFDKGTRHLFESVGLSVQALVDDYGVVGIPLVDAGAEFSYPSRFGDRIHVTSRIGEWRTKTFVVLHEVRNREHLAVKGREVRVWAMQHPDDPARLKALSIPNGLKRRLPAGA